MKMRPTVSYNEPMTKLHFVTFADGSARLRGAARRLARQACNLDIFDTVNFYGLGRIRSDFPGFYSQHIAFISSHPRGLGYWIWKPFLIQQRLLAMPENDVLVYADGGCEFTGVNRGFLLDLFPASSDLDLTAIVLESEHKARRWTTKFCLSHIPGSAHFLDLPQICATIIFFRNTPNTRAFASEWLNLCSAENYGLLIDRDHQNEDAVFAEHRHDQSIFNLLLRHFADHGFIKYETIPVEVASKPDFPILGMRNKTPVSMLTGSRVTRRLALGLFDLVALLRGW
jgi:hypothetical protein